METPVAILLCVVLAIPFVQVASQSVIVAPFPANFYHVIFGSGAGKESFSQADRNGTVQITMNFSNDRVWGAISDTRGGSTDSFEYSVSSPRLSFPWVLNRIDVSPDGRLEVEWPAYPPCNLYDPCDRQFQEYQVWFGVE